MSLQVWLPLTGDLRNQGLLNWQPVVSSGTTATFVNGKLGKALNTGATTMPASFTKKVLNNSAYSYTCWIYVAGETGSTSQRAMIFGNDTMSTLGGRQFSLFQYSTCNDLHWSWQNYTDGTYSSAYGGVLTGVLPSGKWTHIGVTYSNPNVKLYINGEVVYTGSWVSKADSFEFDTTVIWNSAYHYLNDVRLYDNCLSAEEVKEISRGLVLHYPLNHQGWGQENLLKYTKVNVTNQNLLKTVSSGWGNLTLTTKDGYDCYLYPAAQSSTWFSSGSWYSNMKANTTYTYTAWIYFTASANFTFTSLGHFQVYNSASTASDKAHEDVVSARIYEPSTIVANTWTKIRITFTTNDLANSFFVIYPRYSIGTGVGDLYFRDCKLEEGAVSTPWCPNSIDNEYSIMGINSTVEYDCSGYCYNGTYSGITYSSDTPKYSVSTVFNTSTDTITVAPCYSVGQTIDAMTCVIWFKTNTLNSTLPNQVSLGENAFFRFRIASATSIWYYIRVGSTQCSNSFSCKTLTDNNWHHIAVVFDKGYVYIYIDGSIIGTGNHTSTATYMTCNSADSTWHLAGYTATLEPFIGSESDFRIYATALSADDIKSLYESNRL